MPQSTSTFDVPNWIGGRPVASSTGRTIDDVDPATGHVIARVPRSGADETALAVRAAKTALPDWSALDRSDRCSTLRRIADGIEARLEDLARMETQDSGKPITTSRTLDIPRAVRNFRFFADFADAFEDEGFPMPEGHNKVQRRPVGVVGLITPWNLPLYLLTWKVAPALAMGNTVVAKPSELTPQTATALAEIAQAAGLPDGVLNIVHGLGPEAGQALVEHPDVKAVSFTGGTATGRQVASTAAHGLKKVSLELGGKNPSIVLDDADVTSVAAGVARAGFTNTGQVCLCGSRVLVAQSVAAEFTQALQEEVERMPVGDPMDERTRLGPLVAHAHRDKVAAYVAHARSEGAHVWGGGQPDVPDRLRGGAWLAPAVVTGVDQGSRCVQEEIFGPVVTVQTFTDEPDAIRMANDVPYGLAASVWGRDEDRAVRIAEALDTGMVWVNDWLVRDLRAPFGGVKQSGIGREGGRWSLEFFSEPKNIYIGGAAGARPSRRA